MAFKSLVEQAKRRKAFRRYGSDDKITFSGRKVTTKTDKGEKKLTGINLCFSIGHKLVEEAGFINGDLIDILWDPDDELALIRRDNSSGKKITVSKTGRGLLLIRWSEGMPIPNPNGGVVLSGTEIKQGEILFDLPSYKEKSDTIPTE